MALFDQPVSSESDRDHGGSQVEPQPESIIDLIPDWLPPELWLKIHRHILDDLDITAVARPFVLSDKDLLDAQQGRYDLETAQLYVLNPVTLTLIKYYESLFAVSPKHKPSVWENHVRFLFPSVLAMNDIFTAYYFAGHLNQLRRVKVFSRNILAIDPNNRGVMTCLDVDTILDFFSDLKLEHLEYECEHLLLSKDFVHPPFVKVYEDVVNILSSPGWKQLTILGSQHHFDSQNVDQLICEFKNLTRTDPADEYSFDLPGTPTIKNGSEITGLDVARRPSDAKQIFWADNAADVELVPSWLGGGFLSPQIVLVRKQYGVRGRYAGCNFARNSKREWLQGNGWVWNRFREREII